MAKYVLSWIIAMQYAPVIHSFSWVLLKKLRGKKTGIYEINLPYHYGK